MEQQLKRSSSILHATVRRGGYIERSDQTQQAIITTAITKHIRIGLTLL